MIFPERVRYALRFGINFVLASWPYEFLSQLIRRYDIDFYVEVGVFKGETLFRVAKEFPAVSVLGIDPYEAYADDESCFELITRFDQARLDAMWEAVSARCDNFENCLVFRMTSLEAARYYVLKIALAKRKVLVFIDAKHDYESVKEDIEAWRAVLSPGSILCGHDYNLATPGVIRAVNEAFGSRFFVNGGTSIWWVVI